MTPTTTVPSKMMLWEAMSIGAMNSPQKFDSDMNGTARCALACAQDVVSIKPAVIGMGSLHVNYPELAARFPILNQVAACPVNGAKTLIETIIFRLNDTQRWSREAIAQWLRPIEEAFMAQQQSAVASTEAIPVPVTA